MPSKKTKTKSKPKKISKDTPPPERFAKIIAEEFAGRMDLMFENLETIKDQLGEQMREFKFDVMKEFARMDLRFMAVDQRFDKVDRRLVKVEAGLEKVEVRLDKVENKLEETRVELKQEIQEVRTELSEKIDTLGNRIVPLEVDVKQLKSVAQL